MKLGIAPSILLLLTPVATASKAPSPVAARVKSPGPEELSPRGAEIAMRRMAACVVQRAEPRIRRLLDTMPDSRDEQRIFDSLQSRGDWCLPGPYGLAMSPTDLRGAYAEALLTHDVGSAGVSRRNLPDEQIATWQEGLKLDKVPERERSFRLVLGGFARCIVARAPEDVHRLIATDPMSADERTALRALVPSIGPCLDQGTKINITRQPLRSMLADALYQYMRLPD